MPIEAIDDDVPDVYDVFPVLPGTAFVGFHVDDCAHAAVDGLDVGPASLTTIAVAIDIAGADSNESSHTEVFLLDLHTNSESLRNWLTSLGAPGVVSDLSQTSALVPPDFYATVEGRIDRAGSVDYEWNGFVSGTTTPREENLRIFYGPDPTKDYLDSQQVFSRSMGDGQAVVRLGPDSVLGKAVGAPSVDAGIGLREASIVVLREPDSNAV